MQIKSQVPNSIIRLAIQKPKTQMGDSAISAHVKLQPRKPKAQMGDSAISSRVKLACQK
jgi:hypothetical protein